MFNSTHEYIEYILNDLQHPNITPELVNEIVKSLNHSINSLLPEDQDVSEEYVYEHIIHYCPELR